MRFYLLIILLGYTVLQAQPTIPPPTQTDEIIIDNGATGKADPNDRIRYKVTIQNTGTTGATGTQLNIVPDPRTTFVAGTFRSSPLALPDSYASTGNVGITIPVALGLKSNDFDDNIPGLTITAGTFATTQGGSIMISADGSFMYTPAAGFTGSDTYMYTLNDANGVGGGVPATDLGLVTFTVSNLIWFIDNSSVAATSDGRLTSPFKSLADFNAGSTTVGDLTYIEHTGTNYTGGIVLQDNERVYGEGHTGAANLAGVLPFTLAPNSKTLPNINGTRPILTNAGGDGVTLAQHNNLRGFDVGNCSDFGMDNSGTNSIGNLVVSEVAINNATGGGFDASNGSGASMNAVFGSITSTGGVNGIDLTSCAGTFTVNGGTITNPTGTGVLISGGSVVFNSSGVITDNSGFAVDVDNHDSGNVTFSGNITSTGTGIRVQNSAGITVAFSGTAKNLTTTSNIAVDLVSNPGSTINFTNGGLNINTTTGMGFNATGGGSLSITGTANHIITGTGRAVNIDGSTINSVILQDVSATGASTTTIYLNNAGSGGFTITGTGTTTGSGGTINHNSAAAADNNATVGIGVYLNNTDNISLSNMNFTGTFGNFGIRGEDVANFTFKESNMTGVYGTNAAGGFDEAAIRFGTQNGAVSGLTGTALFEGDSINGSINNNLAIYNGGSGSMTFSYIDGVHPGVMGLNGTTFGNDGILIETSGSATATVLINGIAFKGARGDLYQSALGGNSTQNITFTNNICHNKHNNVVSGGGGITINGGGNMSNYTCTYVIHNNSFRGMVGSPIYVGLAGQTVNASGVITNNIIGTNNTSNPQASLVQDSTGASGFGNGIWVSSEKFSGTGTVTHATRIENNQVRDVTGTGISLRSNNQGGGSCRVEATVKNNIVEEVGADSYSGIYAIVGGAGGSDDAKMGVDFKNNNINLNNSSGLDGDNNAISFDQISGLANYYSPGYAGSPRGEYVAMPGTASTNLSTFFLGAPNNNILVNGEFLNIPEPSKVDAGLVQGFVGSAFVLPVP